MVRHAVESSHLKSVGWEDGVLEVEFRKGEIYQYEGVPEHVYQGILWAGSPGKALIQSVVGKFQSTKL